MAEFNAIDEAPVMPHVQHGIKELDWRYPPIEVPPEVDDHVPEQDQMLEQGMGVAEEMIRQSGEFGRRRIERCRET